MKNILENARLFSRALEASGYYTILSDIHRSKGQFGPGADAPLTDSAEFNPGLPVITICIAEKYRNLFGNAETKPEDVISSLLRMHGLIVPSYMLPPAKQDTCILRVVLREGTTLETIHQLIDEFLWAIKVWFACSHFAHILF